MKATPSILSNASKHSDAVPLAQVQQATVLSEQTLRHDQAERHGRILTKVAVQVGDQLLTWYVATFWWASFDDADDYSYVFATQQLAEAAYNETDDAANLAPATFMVHFSSPGKPTKQVPGCIMHKGKIAGYTGPAFTPKAYFSLVHVEAAGLSRQQIEQAIEAGTVWSNEAMLACMLVPGDNGRGVVVEAEPVTVRFEQHHCWETGRNFYELRNQIPAELFRSLVQQAGLFHHVEQEEEEGQWKGWASTDEQALTRVVQAYGWATNIG